MKFSLVNNNTAYANADVYWAILGLNSDGVFAYVNSNGAVTPISTSDNTNMINGVSYANYFFPIESVSSVELSELMTSGRVFIAFGDWLPIRVISPTGYAPPDPTNPSVPGYSTIFDKFEFTYQPGAAQEMNCNTTSVDFLGFPITAELISTGTSNQTVGFTATRDSIITAFQNCPNTNFAALVIPGASSTDPDLRILSPEHAMNTVLSQAVVNYFTAFFDEYLTKSWAYYEQNTLTLQINSASYTGPVIGQVDSSGNFVFYTGTSVGSGTQVLSLSKPTTMEALNCNGVLASGNEVQMIIEKFIAAAINRTMFMTQPANLSNWCGSNTLYYASAPVEYYAQILHANSLNDMCYAFGYDDVCEQSASMQSAGTAKEVILTLPAWN